MRRKIQAKFIRIKIFILLVLACAGVVVPHAMAASDSVWTKSKPSMQVSDLDDPSCRRVPVKILTTNYLNMEYILDTVACVETGKNFSLADGSYIKFNGDTIYRKFYSGGVNAKLLADSDTLLTYNYGGVEANQIKMYKNAAAIIKPNQSNSMYGVFDYSIDITKGIRLLPSSSTPDAQNSIFDHAITKDQKYMVAYVNRSYYLKIDLTTQKVKVLDLNHSTMYLSNAFEHTAITDDGRYVYLHRSGLIMDTKDCGDDWTDTYSRPGGEGVVNKCDSVNIQQDLAQAYPAARWYYKAEFTQGDNALEITARKDGGWEYKKITFYRAGYTPSPYLKYLALGDSISSGEGDTALNPLTGKKYYRAYTDVEEDKAKSQPREKCHLSTRSYPYLLAGWMKLSMDSPKEWNSVACSGATAEKDMREVSKPYDGQAKGAPKLWDDAGIPRLKDYLYKDKLQQIALNEMIPGRVQQIEFVRKYKPDVITLTGGANDVKFGDKVSECISFGSCGWANDKKELLFNEIHGTYNELNRLYTEIYNASGNKSKVYVIGYPILLSDATSSVCGGNISTTLNLQEREMIVQATRYMNLIIKNAAKSAGVAYIDIENSLIGGRLCENSQQYVTGIAFGGYNNERQESLHPNAKGHDKIKRTITEGIIKVSLLNYDNCPNTTENICPDASAKQPDLPPEFGTEEKNVKEQKVTSSTIQKTVASKVSIANYSFEPGSKLKATLHSDPISLGTIGVAGNGGVWADIKLPANTPPGYHTLVLEGKTYSGEPITITQSVVVMGTNTADRDENGVEDTKQPCGLFMAASGKDADLDGIDDACDPQIDSAPQLYRIRVGDPARSYAGAPEKPNYIYVERNTRASAITKVSGDYDPDGDGWAIVGASSGIAYSETTMPDTAPAANVRIVTMNNVPTPYVYFRDGRHGCVSYTPETLAVVKSGEVRKFKLGSTNNAYCRSAAPTEDMDSNNLPDNTQPLYTARKGDTTKGEDPNRLYLLRSFHAAEAQLGISDYNYGGTPAINPDKPLNEWTIMATTQYPIPTTDNYNKLVILKDSSNKPLPILLTKNTTTNQCTAYQPANTLGITEKTLTTRWLNKLSTLPSGISCN